MSAPTFVSLVPSATESLLALGGKVIACTKYCEQPDLPTVGGTKNPEVDEIIALRPNFVVVDVEENRREDADELAAAGVELVITDVRSVTSAIDAVEMLANLVGVAAPNAAVGSFELPTVRRTALIPIWRRPWMALGEGTYGADLLAMLGFDVVPHYTGPEPQAAADRYPMIDIDDGSITPDVVLVPSEPYAFSDAHLDELRSAFEAAAVERVDGQDLLWWGTRTPAAIERLAAALRALSH